MMMKNTIYTFASLPLLLLSSCMELQIGEVIRCPMQTASTIDASKPYKNVAYRVSADEYVYQAPVVTRTLESRSIYLNLLNPHKSSKYYRSPMKATGERRWVRVTRERNSTIFNAKALEAAPDLSRTRKVDASSFSYEGEPVFPFAYMSDRTTMTRRILAAPFDYVIDPIVSIPLTVTTYAAVIVVVPLSYAWTISESEEVVLRADDAEKEPKGKVVIYNYIRG